MATQKKNGVEQTDATLADVLGAITGVGQEVKGLSNKLDSVERRVTALEKKPELKTRIVHQERGSNGTAKVVQAPAAASPRVVQAQGQGQGQDEGEDEAIQAGAWEKVVKTARCYKVGVTKTRNRDSWKIKMYLRGQRRPATLIGWDGTAMLVEFMREVWPAVCEDYFDEEVFAAEDKGKDIPPEFQYDGVHFLVDWFRTAPNYRGHTFINVEGVYPIGE